jgi:O-antigen ligase
MEFLVAILLLVASVWGILFVRRSGFLGMVLATMLIGCCFGHPFWHASLGPLPLTLDRLLVACLTLVYVVARVRGKWLEPKEVRKADILLLIMLAIFGVSTFTHAWQIERQQPLSKLAFLWLMPAALYWITRQIRFREAQVSVLYWSFAGLGVYLGLTALAETRDWNWMIFPKYISSATYAEFLGRGRGPFLNPVGNGLFLTASLASTMLIWPSVRWRGRLVVVLCAAIQAIGIYSTYTRSVWLGAALVSIGVVLYLLPMRLRAPAIATAMIFSIAAVATQWESLLAFKRDKDGDAEMTLDSVKLRPILAYVSWQMFLDRPLAGCGFGQYNSAVRNYIYDRSTPLQLGRARDFVPHNVFLAIVTETGLIGLVAFLGLLGAWTRNCFRQLTRPRLGPNARRQALVGLAVIGCYTINGLFHDISVIAMCNMLLFATAGFSAGIGGVRFNEFRSGRTDRRSASRRAARDAVCDPATVGPTVATIGDGTGTCLAIVGDSTGSESLVASMQNEQ